MEWNLNHLSRYPFLRKAREWVRSRSIGMEEMLTPGSRHIQERALGRIEEAIEGAEIDVSSLRLKGDAETDLLSYPVSRFMVAAVGDSNLIKWFSHHEGERARRMMENDSNEVVLEIGNELGLQVEEPPVNGGAGEGRSRYMNVRIRAYRERADSERRTFWVGLSRYLPPRRNISGPSWDLINTRMVNGLIEVERDTYIRLLQELVKERAEDGLYETPSLPRNERLSEMIKGMRAKVESRRRSYAPMEMGRLTVTRLPPCMRQILGMSQAGENLPHHARFGLVTFLHAIGMSGEEIFKVFSSAPDFKPDVVRYQVDHITGATSSTTYSAPNCDTLKSGGICYEPDSLCAKEWMGNPIIYFRVKGRGRKRAASPRPEDNTS